MEMLDRIQTEVFHDEVINALCAKNDVSSSLKNQVHVLLGNVSFALADLIQILRIVGNDLDTELHFAHVEVEVDKSDLGIFD